MSRQPKQFFRVVAIDAKGVPYWESAGKTYADAHWALDRAKKMKEMYRAREVVVYRTDCNWEVFHRMSDD